MPPTKASRKKDAQLIRKGRCPILLPKIQWNTIEAEMPRNLREKLTRVEKEDPSLNPKVLIFFSPLVIAQSANYNHEEATQEYLAFPKSIEHYRGWIQRQNPLNGEFKAPQPNMKKSYVNKEFYTNTIACYLGMRDHLLETSTAIHSPQRITYLDSRKFADKLGQVFSFCHHYIHYHPRQHTTKGEFLEGAKEAFLIECNGCVSKIKETFESWRLNAQKDWCRGFLHTLRRAHRVATGPNGKLVFKHEAAIMALLKFMMIECYQVKEHLPSNGSNDYLTTVKHWVRMGGATRSDVKEFKWIFEYEMSDGEKADVRNDNSSNKKRKSAPDEVADAAVDGIKKRAKGFITGNATGTGNADANPNAMKGSSAIATKPKAATKVSSTVAEASTPKATKGSSAVAEEPKPKTTMVRNCPTSRCATPRDCQINTRRNRVIFTAKPNATKGNSTAEASKPKATKGSTAAAEGSTAVAEEPKPKAARKGSSNVAEASTPKAAKLKPTAAKGSEAAKPKPTSKGNSAVAMEPKPKAATKGSSNVAEASTPKAAKLKPTAAKGSEAAKPKPTSKGNSAVAMEPKPKAATKGSSAVAEASTPKAAAKGKSAAAEAAKPQPKPTAKGTSTEEPFRGAFASPTKSSPVVHCLDRAKLLATLLRDPETNDPVVPPTEYLSSQIPLLFSIRDFVDALHLSKKFTPPAYKAGCTSGQLTLSNKVIEIATFFGFVPVEWRDDHDRCGQSLKAWLPPTYLPSFHVYLLSFEEACLDANPTITQMINARMNKLVEFDTLDQHISEILSWFAMRGLQSEK